jgi:ABC-type Fe3+-hydroxamate transport system substrate-binding protein
MTGRADNAIVNDDAARVDWSGTLHAAVKGSPRIASLVPSLTELLFDLGLGDHVVARTGFCVHPRDAVRRVPRIGGTKDPDIGKLRALAPTHLIVNVDENRRECIEAAREFVPNIVVTHPLAPAENLRPYALFGALFGREREAAELSARLSLALGHLDAAVAGLKRERVLYLVWKKPWMTVARDTYVSATLARAGFDTLPVTSDRRYPVVADDDPAWAAAERVLLSSEPYAFRTRDVDGLQSHLDKPVTLIDGEWTSWYGSRAIAGLAALAAFRNRLTAAP